MPEVKVGWELPSGAQKNHFFGMDMKSLCGKWTYDGELTEDVPEDDSSQDCAICLRLVRKFRGLQGSAKKGGDK